MSQLFPTTAKAIITQLDVARKDKSEKGIREVFQTLQKIEDAIMNPNPAASGSLQDPEIYVITGELAADFPSCYNIASYCYERYSQINPKRHKKESLARLLIVKAIISIEPNQSQANVMNVVSFVIQAIGILSKLPLPKVSHYIFNASVIYWKACCPFFKDGSRAPFLPSLEVVTRTLDEINETDTIWRIRFLYNLAKCYEECKMRDKAIKAIAQAASLANISSTTASTNRSDRDSNLPLTMKEEILRLRIQLNSNNPESITKIRADIAVGAPGEVTSYLKCVFIVQCAALGIPKDKVKMSDQLKEVLTLTTSGDFIVEVAKVALLAAQNIDLARECAESILNSRKSQNTNNRLKAELILSQIGIFEEEKEASSQPSGIHDYSKLETSHIKRIEALKRVNRTLELAIRTNRSGSSLLIENFIEEACIFTWNAGLPLLNPELRGHVLKPFNRAVTALEEIGSTQTELLRNLHYELAICLIEVEDVLAKAKLHVEKAIALNQSEQFAKFYLEPLKNRIIIRINLYEEPERFEDQALLYIEKAKDAKEPDQQMALLSKSVTALSYIVPNPNTKERGLLWFEIAQLAWKYNIRDLALRSVERFLDNEWSTNLGPKEPLDKQLLRATALGYFIEVEITISTPRLQTESKKQSTSIANARSLASVKSRDRLVGEDLIIKDLSQALNIGVQLKEDWIILNAASYLYNYYSHLFKPGQYTMGVVATYERAVTTFQEMFTALSQNVTANRSNVMVLLTLCDGFACMLEQFYYVKKRIPPSILATATPPATAPTTPAVAKTVKISAAATPSSNSSPAEQVSELKMAEDTCKVGLAWTSDSILKNKLLRTWTRLQLVKGVTPTTAPSSVKELDQVIILLEISKNIPENTQKRTEYVTKMTELLEDSEKQIQGEFALKAYRTYNAELIASVSFEALNLKLFVPARQLMKKVLDLVPEEDDSSNKRRPWCWISLAEFINAKLLESTIADAASNSSQNRTRENAIQHFAASAEYAVNSDNVYDRSSLIIQATEAFWNTAIPFMKAKTTRQILLFPLQDIIQHLHDVNDEHWEIQVQLYTLLFTCMKDQRLWENGFIAAQEALRLIPKEYARKLWRGIILFVRKMNRSVSLGMFAKDNDQTLQAEVYALAARSGVDVEEQRVSWEKAIQAASGNVMQKAEYMIEFAQWIHTNNRPLVEAERLFEEAATSIMGLEGRLEPSSVEEGVNVPLRITIFQLETVMRAWVSLARISPKKRHQSCLNAYAIVIKMWESTVNAVNATVTITLNDSKGTDSSKKPPSSTNFVVNTTLPIDLQSWIDFQPSDALKKCLQMSEDTLNFTDTRAYFINTSSIDIPLRTVHYLYLLCEEMEVLGLHALSLPVLHMIQAIVGDIIRSEPLLAVNYLRLAKLLETLRINPNKAVSVEKLVTNAVNICTITNELRVKYREQIRQHEYVSILATKNTGGSTVRSNTNAMSSRKHQRTSRSTMATTRGAQVESVVTLEENSIQDIWVTQAELLIEFEYFGVAKELLIEALFHARAFEDKYTVPRCYHYLAVIAFHEADPDNSIRKEIEALNLGDADINLWIDIILSLVNTLIEEKRYTDAEMILGRAIAHLRNLVSIPEKKCMLHDASIGLVKLKHQLAQLCLKIGQLSFQRKDMSDSNPDTGHRHDSMFTRAEDMFQKIKTRLVDYAPYSLLLLEVMLSYAGSHIQYATMIHNDLLLQINAEDLEETAISLPDDHQYLTNLQKASELLKETESYALRILSNVMQNTLPPAFKQQVSLPVNRYLAKIKLTIAKLELDFSNYLEVRPKVIQKDSSLKQVLEILDRESGNLQTTHAELALTASTSAVNMLDGVPRWLADALYIRGRCLAHLSRPHRVHLAWKTSQALELSNDNSMLLDMALKCFEKSAEIGMQYAGVKDIVMASMASCEYLIDIFHAQQYNNINNSLLTVIPSLSYLILLQSYTVQLEHMALYNRVSVRDDIEKLYLTVGSKLLDWKTMNPHSPNTVKYLQSYSLAYKRLNVATPIDEIIRNMSKNVTVVVLQHSVDKRYLYYGAYSTELADCRINRMAVDQAKLNELLSLRKSFLVTLQNWKLKSAKVTDESEAAERFNRLLEKMEQFFAPLFELYKPRFKSQLVIMPDRILASLPLEALSIFQSIPLVSRDFSLHYFYSRTQEQRSLAVRRKFGYIVDPYNEGALPPTHPSKAANISDWFIGRVTKSKTKQAGKGWEGIAGTERWPSPEEWQQVLLSSNAFVYWGYGQMLSHVDPCFLGVLSLQDLSAVFMVTQGHTNSSYRRQGKLDTKLRNSPKMYDDCVDSAALLSLRGVNSIVSTQWGESNDNSPVMLDMFDMMLGNAASSIGEAMNVMRTLAIGETPPSRKLESRPSFNAAKAQAETVLRPMYERYNAIVYGLPTIQFVGNVLEKSSSQKENKRS